MKCSTGIDWVPKTAIITTAAIYETSKIKTLKYSSIGL